MLAPRGISVSDGGIPPATIALDSPSVQPPFLAAIPISSRQMATTLCVQSAQCIAAMPDNSLPDGGIPPATTPIDSPFAQPSHMAAPLNFRTADGNNANPSYSINPAFSQPRCIAALQTNGQKNRCAIILDTAHATSSLTFFSTRITRYITFNVIHLNKIQCTHLSQNKI